MDLLNPAPRTSPVARICLILAVLNYAPLPQKPGMNCVQFTTRSLRKTSNAAPQSFTCGFIVVFSLVSYLYLLRVLVSLLFRLDSFVTHHIPYFRNNSLYCLRHHLLPNGPTYCTLPSYRAIANRYPLPHIRSLLCLSSSVCHHNRQ